VRLLGDVSPATIRRYQDVGYEHLVFSPFTRLPRTATLAEKVEALEQAVEVLAPVWDGPDSR
jgi:hypothetical protein